MTQRCAMKFRLPKVPPGARLRLKKSTRKPYVWSSDVAAPATPAREARVAITLAQDGAIATRPPARYCFAVARYVLLEDLRRDRRLVPFDESRATETNGIASHGTAGAERDIRERRLDCLDHCLAQLKPEQRELIVEYYAESRQLKIQRRRELAVRLGISMNALAIRAWRIREGLMACVRHCGERR